MHICVYACMHACTRTYGLPVCVRGSKSLAQGSLHSAVQPDPVLGHCRVSFRERGSTVAELLASVVDIYGHLYVVGTPWC